MFYYVHPFMASMWLLFGGIAVLLLIAAVLLSARDCRTAETRPATPQEILRMRYARGEIDESELQRRLSMLSAGGPVPR